MNYTPEQEARLIELVERMVDEDQELTNEERVETLIEFDRLVGQESDPKFYAILRNDSMEMDVVATDLANDWL